MSAPNTGYICKDASGVYQDLSAIFQPLNGGAQAAKTGFDVCGNDLNTIFAAASGTYIDFSTNYISNGLDLALIFAPISNIKYKTTGNPSITTSTNYTFLTFTGNGTVTFLTQNSVSVNYLLVGGGGSGGAGGGNLNSNNNYVFGGGGGASGAILQDVVTVEQNYNCAITIGSGGVCTSSYTPNNGSSSCFQYSPSVVIDASGGNFGSNGSLTYPTSDQSVAGGASSYGNGGNGDMYYFPYSGNWYSGVGCSATNYSEIYSNFSIDGVNLGTFGGGGGGGTIFGTPGGSGMVLDPSGLYCYAGQGSGSLGGSINNSNNYVLPIAAINGGGGGGGTITSFPTKHTQQESNYYMAGSSGGDGVAILWFSNDIT